MPSFYLEVKSLFMIWTIAPNLSVFQIWLYDCQILLIWDSPINLILKFWLGKKTIHLRWVWKTISKSFWQGFRMVARQPVLGTQSIAIVPVRSKKHFTPPTYEPKYKSEEEFIEHTRKAGLVIPPECLARPIHLTIWPVQRVSLMSVFLQRSTLRCHLFQWKDWHKTERWKKNVELQLSI